MKPFIQFKDFTFKYDIQAEPTLKSLNLTIEKGQKVLIIGPSGSGKSTIGHCLNGIIPNIYHGEKSGQFTIDGKEAFGLSIYDKSHLVSTVLQDPDGQFIGLTVAEDLAFALENDCVSLEEMQEKVAHWAKRLDLTEFLDNRPQDLSGGQKQRVSLAGVLIDESPILLFDEPLANLDPKSGQETIDLIDRIHHEEKATTIIIEHRLEDVLYRHVDKVVLVNDGQILFDGHPDELLRTELLIQNGIREPLYVTALKDLGVDVTSMEHLSDLSQIDLTNIAVTAPSSFQEEAPQDKLLTVEQLHFAYQENRPILKNINFEINQGERIAIVGKNGAGKSTLAKAICQFITPEGDIRYRGQSIMTDSIKERAEKIGYVLQNPNQMISQTMIFDEVALGLRLRGVDEQDVEKRVLETLKVCGLYEFRKWPISALSFGQKKRVTIASVLVMNPEIILLDEPTAGQDKRNYTEIMNFLNQLNKAGHTIIMITHDMQLMLEYSDRSIIVSNGEIIADCSPVALFNQNAILEKANLKKTSLFELAEKLAVDPIALTHYYIEKEGGIHG
ncbi:heme ABC transporter ATP-binding protein [Streptococcus gallolyticus subsp. gallolyticus]|uniref:Cobalt ABC transporter, ATP binding protein n=1 Tax=Streptococcus gallolyticus (strain UCN34) TaxID=637909 RepID=A0AA36JZ98_STRG3|nr:ABC transporter ATP-binding protein [Streptococcus gallolyticus]KJE98501.1 heme ABC transporter ATP-binding protein [Streptococcus gallolyticus subsp. gallolyticus]MCY7158310.1 ABC transporter ATP-binding protein [Streptococcus gallolyticus subsp. gallolyticus]MCY7177614.1 ABC transporter ATP-binding protein [Streptococcus gallolyticus subsp. gallolyticus]MCY7193081.1 ABC transporter ATP-binding protein [Streptococcus gallolyticus subsp. gallolyticus]OAV84177.1 heme ABC transporter ATP-bind